MPDTTIARICARSVRCDRGYLTPCRVFTGAIQKGYGRIGRGARKVERVHLVVYEHVFGSVTPGRDVHHRCGQKDCHEPLHLVEMTHREHLALHRAGVV